VIIPTPEALFRQNQIYILQLLASVPSIEILQIITVQSPLLAQFSARKKEIHLWERETWTRNSEGNRDESGKRDAGDEISILNNGGRATTTTTTMIVEVVDGGG
jgi:hypothetical protein